MEKKELLNNMARKWRPSLKCLYVISEVYGNAKSLEVIFNRILPLRKHKGSEDQLIFLGDYIDKGTNSADVIDMLINVKSHYGNRVRFIRGNHEQMLLNAFQSEHSCQEWIHAGGVATIDSYLHRTTIKVSPYGINFLRLKDIIPNDHLQFIQQTELFAIVDNYCFIHSGFNPTKSIADNDSASFPLDPSSSNYIKTCINRRIDPNFMDTYIYVCAQNPFSNGPAIHPKYMMLSGSNPRSIYLTDLNSMQIDRVQTNKSRIYKYDYKLL